MKRDMDLIREILLQIEDSDGVYATPKQIEGYSDNQWIYHLKHLKDGGILEGGLAISADEELTSLSENTWCLTQDGHDLLDVIRSPKIWGRIKRQIEITGGWTLDSLFEFASSSLKEASKNIAYVYRVMIATPSDVIEEIKEVRNIIYEWNYAHSMSNGMVLLPVRWDTHAFPEMGAPPQEIINRQILRDCDLLVAVFWTRIGSSTGKAISGTVEEIEEHIKQGKPVMIYFSNKPIPLDKIDNAQLDAVKEFKKFCSERGLICTYESLDDFRTNFSRHLSQIIFNNPYFSTSKDADNTDFNVSHASVFPKERSPVTDLSDEAQRLLVETSEDNDGKVGILVMGGGDFRIQTNQKQFVERGNPRSRAMWEGAIKELCLLDLLEVKGYKGETFKITSKGYKVADEIKKKRGDQ